MPDQSDQPPLPETLTTRVAFLLQLALARAQAMGEQALRELGINGREYGILALLEGSAPAPPAQHRLGAALGIDRTTTVKILTALENRGLVDRTPDPANRRAYLVTLTAAGDRLRVHAATVLADCDERFLDRLPDDEKTHLRAVLTTLI